MKKLDISKEKLIKLLDKHNFSKEQVGKEIGCHRQTITNLCNKYKIDHLKKVIKFTFEEVKKYFIDQGCELLESQYFNNHYKMNYKCVCGNTSTINFLHFKHGERCRECKRKNLTGSNNPKWNLDKTDQERIDGRKYLAYTQWSKKILERDNYTCQICKKRGGTLHAHHLFGYDKFVDKRLDINNGITLCLKCHKEFHQIYGYGNNTREQFVNSFLFCRNEASYLDFLDVTIECAKSVYNHLGCGNSKEIDRIATNAIRNKLNSINFSGKVVLCEGIKDNSFGLFDEKVGKFNIPILDVDIICDPVDGSTRSSYLQSDACSILAMANKGAFYLPESHYMKKLVVKNDIYDKCHVENMLDLSVNALSKKLHKILNRQPIISLLKRDRNNGFIEDFLKSNCKIKLINDCDCLGALLVFEDKIDLFYGIGGATETLLVASATKCLKGRVEAQCVDKLWNTLHKPISNENLVNGYSVFIATGITDGEMLNGIKYTKNKITTNSLYLNSHLEQNSIRRIITDQII